MEGAGLGLEAETAGDGAEPAETGEGEASEGGVVQEASGNSDLGFGLGGDFGVSESESLEESGDVVRGEDGTEGVKRVTKRLDGKFMDFIFFYVVVSESKEIIIAFKSGKREKNEGNTLR